MTTKLLEQVIERVRELPEHEQDIAAAEMLGYLADFPTADERIAISAGLDAFERGNFATLDDWRHEMGLAHN